MKDRQIKELSRSELGSRDFGKVLTKITDMMNIEVLDYSGGKVARTLPVAKYGSGILAYFGTLWR